MQLGLPAHLPSLDCKGIRLDIATIAAHLASAQLTLPIRDLIDIRILQWSMKSHSAANAILLPLWKRKA